MRIYKPARIASAFLAVGLLATACSSETSTTPDETTSTDPSDVTSQSPSGGAGTLATVTDRGELICGVSGQLAGFSLNDNGSYSGLDVDYCRAVAAAVLGDADAVQYRDLTAETRFTALSSGDVDVLMRNGTWTASRDGSLGLQWTATTYYDGQGMLVPADSAYADIASMDDNPIICVQTGTTTELNLQTYFANRGLAYEPLNVADEAGVTANFGNDACDGYTTDRSGLASFKSTYAGGEVKILPDVMSKEPLGPAVREGDEGWYDIVQWVVFATFQAEEFDLNSGNIAGFSTDNADIQRFIDSKDGDVGLGFPTDGWVVDVITAVGNYQEIFDRNIAPLGLDAGVNQLWTEGGLHYAPPFR